MAKSEFFEQLKPCIQYVEGFLSSAESCGDLVTPLDESVEILRTLLSLSSALPSRSEIDDELHQNVSHIFENGIRVIDNILLFQANSAENSKIEEVCNLHRVFEDIVPELKMTDFRSCVVKSSFKLDQPSEDNLSRYLQSITKAMENIFEALTCFESAFSLCKDASAFVEACSVVWPELKDLIMEIESKTVKSYEQTSESHFSSMFLSTLDRLFKISTNALRLLFTFPEIEDVEFDVLLSLCQSVVHIFMCAVGILNCLNQLFLKDSCQLKALVNELSQSGETIHTFCSKLFEVKSNTEVIFENVCEKCSSVNDSENSAINMNDGTVPQNLQGASVSLNAHHVECNNMNEPMKNERILQKESTVNACDATISHLCDTKDNDVDEVQSASVPENLCPSTSAASKVISTPTAFVQSSNDNSCSKNVKSEAKTKTTTVPETYTLFNFLSSGLLKIKLTLKHVNVLEKVIKKYRCHVYHFFGFITGGSKFLVTCKLCDETLPVEIIEKHMNNVLHLLNVSKNSQKNLKTCTVISVLFKSNFLSSPHSSNLSIDFRDINFDLLTLNQRKVLEEVITKIKNYTKHYSSYTIQTTNSKLHAICNTCGKVLLSETIEDQNMHENYELCRNVNRACQSRVAACTAMPEINFDKWQFLDFPSDTRHSCSLCAITSSSSTNSFVQHIHSFVHQSKIQNSQFQDSAETKYSNLVGFAHFFHDSLTTKFASLEVSQKQDVDTLGAKLKSPVNSLLIKRNRNLIQISFVCHLCGWSINWKNAPEQVTCSENYYYASLPSVFEEEERVYSNGILQSNNFYENHPEADRASSSGMPPNNDFYEDFPIAERESSYGLSMNNHYYEDFPLDERVSSFSPSQDNHFYEDFPLDGRVSSFSPSQDNHFYEDLLLAGRVSSYGPSRNSNFYEDLPETSELLRRHDHVLWCKEMVQKYFRR